CHLDGAAGMQQGFEEGGFAGARVACEGHVADLFRRIGHAPCLLGRAWRGPAARAGPAEASASAVMAVRWSSAAVRAGPAGSHGGAATLARPPRRGRVASQHAAIARRRDGGLTNAPLGWRARTTTRDHP